MWALLWDSGFLGQDSRFGFVVWGCGFKEVKGKAQTPTEFPCDGGIRGEIPH